MQPGLPFWRRWYLFERRRAVAHVIEADFPNAERPNAERGVLSELKTSSIACLNLSPATGHVSGNLRMAEKAILEARREEPALSWIVLPELVTCGYSNLESVHRYAEDAAYGESARFFAGLAQDLGIHIAYGFPEVVPGTIAGVFDSANLVGPEGILATYRKRNLVRTTAEYRVFTPGTELPVVDVDGVWVALAICWDLGFPEVVREAAMSGADLILAPAAWRAPWGPQYDLSCAARALDSGVYVASANQLGSYSEVRFDAPGHVHGPDGRRVSRSVGAASIGRMDPDAPGRWRALYGNTIIEDEKVTVIGEEPLELSAISG